MNADESETLSARAKNLIVLEQQREGPSANDEQRVFDRLVEAKAFLPAAAGGLASNAVVMKVVIGAVVGAVAGGSAVGAWFSGQLQDARAALVQARAAVPEPVPTAESTAAPSAPPSPPEPSSLAPPPPAANRKLNTNATAAKPTAKLDSLNEEAALIDQARTALLKSDLSAAAAALEQHRTKFPQARMVEEREVMLIQVLLGQGREADARAVAERFRQRHPSSLLRPTVDELFPPVP